ncbi:hypothetical protein D3C72_712270 [compost metagenome]
MALAMPSGEAIKAAPKFRTQPRSENERMKKRIVGARCDGTDQFVAALEGMVTMVAANTMHVPFEIGSGSGAGFDIDIAVTAKGRDHEDIGADDRFVCENLIDAPGTSDDGSFPGINDARPHGAGDHIEETANDGRAFGQPRDVSSLACHMADDVGRFHETGEKRERVLKIVK